MSRTILGATSGAVRQAGAVGDRGRVQPWTVAGFPVQTARLATQPLSRLPGDPLRLAAELWSRCADAGFEYLSLGPVLADAPDADLIAAGRSSPT